MRAGGILAFILWEAFVAGFFSWRALEVKFAWLRVMALERVRRVRVCERHCGCASALLERHDI